MLVTKRYVRKNVLTWYHKRSGNSTISILMKSFGSKKTVFFCFLKNWKNLNFSRRSLNVFQALYSFCHNILKLVWPKMPNKEIKMYLLPNVNFRRRALKIFGYLCNRTFFSQPFNENFKVLKVLSIRFSLNFAQTFYIQSWFCVRKSYD